jgi:hypothetical protein
LSISSSRRSSASPHPAGYRRQRQQHQPLADDKLAQLRPSGAQGFEDRHQIVAAAAVVAHRHRHRGDRQQQRQQRGQQELLRAFQGFAQRAVVLLRPIQRCSGPSFGSSHFS